MATVPNLVGMPLERAAIAAGNAGLLIGTPTYVQLPDRPEGTIVAQEPSPGTVVTRGSSVEPTVATARQLVVIPDVRGYSESEAVVALSSAGLKVGERTTAPDRDIPAGSVISTVPEPRTQVAAGTPVALVVSTGPAGPSLSPSPSASPSLGPSASPSPSPVATPSPTASPGPTPTAVASPTGGPGPSPNASVAASPSPGQSATASPSPSP
jgi:beta-lactam-binding protein with PASTA domain